MLIVIKNNSLVVFTNLSRCLISYLQFAIVQLLGAQSPIKALLLVWNDKQVHFTGLIHLDQVTNQVAWTECIIDLMLQLVGVLFVTI